MNYMKKLLGGGGAGPPPLANQDPQDALGLTHLNKLYGELAEPSEPLTQAEQQLKLYNMLPLFCKVFHSCPAESMQASFEYVVPFARAVAKLLVSVRFYIVIDRGVVWGCAIGEGLTREDT